MLGRAQLSPDPNVVHTEEHKEFPQEYIAKDASRDAC